MRILFADDGVSYDGQTPAEAPLGGGERAVVGLARALAARGHAVSVATAIIDPVQVDGVDWLPLPLDEDDRSLPEEIDVLVAVRRPSLLALPVRPGRRAVWVLGRPDALVRPSVRARLAHYRPDLMFLSHSQKAAGPGASGMSAAVIPPGVSGAVLKAGASPTPPLDPPVAITAAHPLHGGLDWLLDQWEHGIAPAVPYARLHVYSALLSAGLAGEAVPEALLPMVERVRRLSDANVSVREPQPEADLIAVWPSARVYLHPGQAWDHACWPLLDTQALGVPAVARPLGGAAERIVNGDSGMLVPDDEAFVNVTVQILTDGGVHSGMADEAAAPGRRRGWDAVAADVESQWFRFGR